MKHKLPRRLVLTLGLVLVLGLAAGAWTYRAQARQMEERVARQLALVAQTKVTRLQAWREQRLAEAAYICEGPNLNQAVARWLVSAGAEDEAYIRDRLEARLRHLGYHNILVLDAQHQPRLSLRPMASAELPPAVIATVEAAQRTGHPALTAIYPEAATGEPQCVVIAPLTSGAVVMVPHTAEFLAAVIAEWPTPAESAETRLVQPGADDLLQVRRRQPAGPVLLERQALASRAATPEQWAGRQVEGPLTETVDATGVPLIAQVQRVPDSSWLVVTQIARHEAVAEWRWRALLTVAMVVVLGLALLAAIATLWWQRQRARELGQLAHSLRRAQAELAATNRLQQAVLDGNAFCIIATRADGIIEVFNAGAEQMLGYRRSEVIGQATPALFHVPEELAARTAELAARYGQPLPVSFAALTIEARSGQVEEREWMLVRKDGTRLLARLSVAALRDSHGEPAGFVGIAYDITERKRLAHELQVQAAELRRSNADLEQFAFVASHDLKAPLRAIDNLAAWLHDDLGPQLTGESAHHLALLRQRVARMGRLLDALLEYSRAGRVHLDVQPVDVAALVAEVVEQQGFPPGFAIQCVAPLPVFHTAVTPLRQVFTNLLGNAVKHHDRPTGTVTVSATDLGEAYAFAIADDGPGIPEPYRERVFALFTTLRPRDQVEGSGIGLALVKRIVERYGGTVTIGAGEPRGAVFRFTWPKTWASPPGGPAA